MVQVLTDAAQRSGIELPIDDTFWKTATESSSDPIQLKVYAPLSCKGIREQFGVTMHNLAASFAPRDSFQIKPKGRIRRKDETIVAPSGPYVVRSISSAELKFLLKIVARLKMQFEDCMNSILPRFYMIFRVDKLGGSRRKKEHWVLTDNLNHLPLTTLERYDLKGCPWARITGPAEKEHQAAILKDGNVGEGKEGLQQFPQVSPWDSRQLLSALEGDLAVLEELKATNYSVYVVVAAPRGDEEEGVIERGPSRPPYIRLGGEQVTLFASIVDILQEWGASTRVVNVLRIFQGPGKAKTAMKMSPAAFAERLLAFIGGALHESAQERTKVDEVNWSMAVRTKASLSPQSYLSPAATQNGGNHDDDPDWLPTPTRILTP